MKKPINALMAAAALSAALWVVSQPVRMSGQIKDTIRGGRMPRIAVTDFRGTGKAQQFMNTFNETVWNDLADAGVLDLVGKSVYPIDVPQQATDFRPPVIVQPAKVGDAPSERSQGPWLTDWSRAPVSADYLGFGYAAERPGQLVVYGNFYDVRQPDAATARVFLNPYAASLDEAGALKIAHEYAADILKQLGVPSLAGSKIWFISDRSGKRELWSMDHDGKNQRQFTHYGTSVGGPAISVDGKMVAFRVEQKDARGVHWQLRVHSTVTGGQIAAHKPPDGGTISAPSFTPDGKMLYYALSTDGWMQIVRANVNGSGLELVSKVRAVETEPKVNPRTGTEMMFTSGRSGTHQVWRATTSGAGVQMVTDGTGYAANPAWSPLGTHIAFSWTRGYEIGGYNIFVIDVAEPKNYKQLTYGGGTHEDPTWAPDGAHLVYALQPKGSRVYQLYTMLANGTRQKQLTSQGSNFQPVWAPKVD